jgi:hypothetical protein
MGKLRHQKQGTVQQWERTVMKSKCQAPSQIGFFSPKVTLLPSPWSALGHMAQGPAPVVELVGVPGGAISGTSPSQGFRPRAGLQRTHPTPPFKVGELESWVPPKERQLRLLSAAAPASCHQAPGQEGRKGRVWFPVLRSSDLTATVWPGQ